MFTEVGPQTGYDLWTVALDGVETDRPQAGEPAAFQKTSFNEGSVSMSPDGR
jgi:hypothetical protein